MSLPHRLVVRLLLLGSAPTAFGACTMVGVGAAPTVAPRPAELEPDPSARPTPAEAYDGPADGITVRVVEVALESIGTPYEWGGTDANGFDCSGLIQYAYGRFGVRLPRTSAAQMRAGSPVDPEPPLLRPGDVLGFSADRSRKTSHVGLYIGGDEFIHSSSSGVRISTLRNRYWRDNLVAVRRVVE